MPNWNRIHMNLVRCRNRRTEEKIPAASLKLTAMADLSVSIFIRNVIDLDVTNQAGQEN